MPRLKPRLPSASGGRPPPEFDIDDALRRQIETRYLASVDLTDKSPEFLIEFYAQIVEATRQYLWTASLTASAEPIDLRAALINRALIAATEFQEALDAINAGGDAGDHINALLERHFWHPSVPHSSDDGTSAILASISSASRHAFAQARDQIAAEGNTGFKRNQGWENWVRRVTKICDDRGLPTSARKDDDKRRDIDSAFVQLMWDLQQNFASPYRRGEQSPSALANAIYRARRRVGNQDPT
jgi:hypothetical protein